jgi:hypothetical protein
LNTGEEIEKVDNTTPNSPGSKNNDEEENS